MESALLHAHQPRVRSGGGDAPLLLERRSREPAPAPGEATVRTDSSVRVLDTEASLAEFGLTDKFAGKRVFVFQPKPGDKDPARGAFILEADSSATMHAWITALSEAVSEARHTAAGGAGGGVTSAAAGNERTDASADASGQPQRRKRFLGALERAGLVGPLGGPAIRKSPRRRVGDPRVHRPHGGRHAHERGCGTTPRGVGHR